MKNLFSLVLCIFSFSYCTAQEYISHSGFQGGLGSGGIYEDGEFFYHVFGVKNTIEVGLDGKTEEISGTLNNNLQIGVAKYDRNFNIIWVQTIARSNDVFVSIPKLYFTDEFVIVSYINKSGTSEFRNIDYLNKIDPTSNGRIASVYAEKGISNYIIDVSGSGRIAVTGTFRGFLEVKGIQFTQQLNQTGNSDIFILTIESTFRLDQLRQLRRGFGFPGLNNRNPHAMKFQDDETLTLYGQYEGSVQVDNIDDNILKTGNFTSTQGGFVFKMAQNGDVLQFDKHSSRFLGRGEPSNRVGDNFLVKFDEGISVFDKDFNFIKLIYDRLPIIPGFDKSTVVNNTLLTVNHITTPLEIDNTNIIPNESDILVIAYDQLGNKIWHNLLGSESEGNFAITLLSNNKGGYFLNGHTVTPLDLDPSRNKAIHSELGFMAEYSIECQNLGINLLNSTNVSCDSSGQVTVGIRGGSDEAVLIWTHNNSKELAQDITIPGIYEAIVQDTGQCSRSLFIPVSGPSDNGIPKAFLRNGPYRSGFDTSIFIDLRNNSCVEASGTITLELEEQITFLSSEPSPESITGNIITYSYDNIDYDDGRYLVTIQANVDADAQFGTDLCNFLQVTDIEGNQLSKEPFCTPVINSFDPNDIQVFPNGRCADNFYTIDETLTYLIRFQNLGNAEAINIIVADTLDSNHDIKTLSIVETSHNYQAYVEEDSILIIEFIDINLPAEVQNEEASNGFIRYIIKTLEQTQAEARPNNQAAIYFDFNDPVITNEVTSTLVEKLPNCIVTNTINPALIDINIFPSPTSGNFTIDNMTGQDLTIKIYNAFGQFIDQHKLGPSLNQITIMSPDGIYIVKMLDNNGLNVRTEKILLQK